MNKNIRKNIQAYDTIVEEFYKNTKDIEQVEIEIRKEFLSYIKKGDKILDLGCGPGRDAKAFTDLGYKVIGVDLSEKCINKAKTIAPEAEFKVMDFLNLDFEKESFDAVWFSAGLLCVEKRFALNILNEINKILIENGILFISVKEGKGEGFQLDKRYNVEKYYAYYTEEEVRRLLIDADFEIIKVYLPNLKSSYHKHQWIGVLCRKH